MKYFEKARYVLSRAYYCLKAGLVSLWMILGFLPVSSTIAQQFPALPQGNTGIAARHPGDSGIASDTTVIYADNFESYASAAGLSANWNGGVYHDVRITTTAANVFAGKQAVEFYLPKQTVEWSNTVARDIARNQELEVLFLRYYTKFDALFDVSGSCHNGGGMSAHYFLNGQATPGVPANGYNKFLAEFESWRATAADTSPGLLNVYIYQPEQRSQWGDHFFPNGEVMPNTSLPGNFGTEFVPRPNIRCKLGQWYCCELMIKANTVGVRNGRIACWLDGVLIADFTNLRLRDVDSLKINRFNLSLHAGSNGTRETYKWYDNVVAAKSYIGPMVQPGSTHRQANQHITLKQNPSVCGSTISFTLEQSSPVSIDIYTVQGKITNRVINREMLAGRHTINGNNQKETRGTVAKGIFITRMKASGNITVEKMAVTR